MRTANCSCTGIHHNHCLCIWSSTFTSSVLKLLLLHVSNDWWIFGLGMLSSWKLLSFDHIIQNITGNHDEQYRRTCKIFMVLLMLMARVCAALVGVNTSGYPEPVPQWTTMYVPLDQLPAASLSSHFIQPLLCVVVHALLLVSAQHDNIHVHVSFYRIEVVRKDTIIYTCT